MSFIVCWKSPAKAEHALSMFSRFIEALLVATDDNSELEGIAHDVFAFCGTTFVGPGL